MGAIDNFRALMNKSGGFARLARYEVVLRPPPRMPAMFKGVDISGMTRDISMMCDTISMPGHDLQTQSIQYGSAPETDQVTSHGYAGQIIATFYADADLTTKMFFDAWQQLAVNPATHKANYYNDYIGSMEIYQMSTKAKRNVGPNRVPGPHAEIPNEKHAKFEEERTYGVRASEVYPKTVGAISYAASSANEIATLDVRFEFRQWYNIGTDNKFGTADSELRPF